MQSKIQIGRALIIGDSYVEGVGSTSGGWAKGVADRLPGAVVDIDGVGGRTTTKLLDRLLDIRLDQYDLVILQIGVNDSRYRPSKEGMETSETDFLNNIQSIYSHVSSNIRWCYFVGLTKLDDKRSILFKHDKEYHTTNVSKYDNMLRNFCLSHCCGYIEIPDLSQREELLVDGLHPSEAGHKLIQLAVSVGLYEFGCS